MSSIRLLPIVLRLGPLSKVDVRADMGFTLKSAVNSVLFSFWDRVGIDLLHESFLLLL